MRDLPKPYQVLTHFKGTKYIFLATAEHTETGEALAIYSRDGKIWARPLEMFLSEVPADKENPTGQKWRFENI